MIPHQPNPFFTGRQRVLDDLRSAFIGEEARLLKQVLIGQPGIGKTQVAVEYVYRYSKEYQTILWVTADTRDVLISDYLRLAAILDLTEKDDPDKQRVIDGVKQWLNNHQGWLLVVDNADDPNLLGDFLPQEGQGHVLLTARDPEVGTRAYDYRRRKQWSEKMVRRSCFVVQELFLSRGGSMKHRVMIERRRSKYQRRWTGTH